MLPRRFGNPEQWPQHPCPVPQHDHWFAPDDPPLATPAYTRHRQPRSAMTCSTGILRALGPYVRRSTGLLLFLPGPHPVARIGRNPRRRSDHRMVDRSFDRSNPHAVLSLLSEGTVFQVFRHLCYPHRPLIADDLPSLRCRNLQTGGCPWLANLEPLPPSLSPYNSSQFAASVDDAIHPTSSAFLGASS